MGAKVGRARRIVGVGLKWLADQAGALLATAIFTPIVAWASLRYAEVRQFAESDPLLFIGSIALLGLAVYGAFDLLVKAWRWFRRPPPAGLLPAIPTAREEAPSRILPDANHQLYTRDRFGLRIGVDRGLFHGLGCRWEWEGDRIVRPEILCPDCWEVPTLRMPHRSMFGTDVSCDACGFRAKHADEPKQITQELARLAREKARGDEWRKVVADRMDSKGNAP